MNCIVCGCEQVKVQGAPRTEERLKNIQQGTRFRVVFCRRCGFAYVMPPMNTIGVCANDFYEECYFSKDVTGWGERKRSCDRQERLRKMEQFASTKIRVFLDVGCGKGDMINAAADKYPFVYGQDIVSYSDLAKLRVPKENIFIGSLEKAGYKDNMFDAIYLDSVLEHVSNPVEFLNEAKRILSPGGCLYVGVPNEFSTDKFFKGLIFAVLRPGISSKIDPFRYPYHVIGFSKKSLRILSEKCGLKVRYLRTFGGTYEFRKFHFTTPVFWKALFLWPFYALGCIFNNAFYIEAYFTKSKENGNH